MMLPLYSLAAIGLLASSAQALSTPAFTGAMMIQPGANSTRCMTAASNADGALVTIEACTAKTNQLWTFDGSGVRIFGNKCLDVKDGVNQDGTKLQIWTCATGSKNQGWIYTQFGDNHMVWNGTSRCMDLSAGSLASGNQVQVWACSSTPNQIWNVGFDINNLPAKSANGQAGTNACGTTSSQSSMCQNAWINAADDFCLWAPPSVGTIGDTEREEVSWCTKSGRGTRVMPQGTLKGVHFVKTPDYVQVTGVGDFTKINVKKGDEGGELDPHGADSKGNPIGGLVFGKAFGVSGQPVQYHEWTSFMSDTEFCFRACVGQNAARNCQHIYDEMGCFWNMPANYDAGVFENCDGDDDLPMGVYGTSTWHQGTSPTPSAHPVAKSSNCKAIPSVTPAPARRRRDTGMEYVRAPAPTAPAF